MPTAVHVRRKPWGGVWAVLLLVAVEVGGLRSGLFWEAIQDSPAFQELPSENLPPHALVRALALRAQARRAGGFPGTVVVTGSSVAAYGVDVPTLSAALGRPVRLLWEAGADFPLLAAMADYLLPDIRPDIVVLAASPHAAVERVDPDDLARRDLYTLPRPRDLAEFADVQAQRLSHVHRFQAPLWQFADLRLQRFMARVTGATLKRPIFDFTEANAPDLWAERRAWERTGQIAHYWRSMERIVMGQPAMAVFADDFETRMRRPPDPQWEALDHWVATVRAAGAEPVIVVFPFNMMVTRADFSTIALGRASGPIVPPETVRQFCGDLEALAVRHHVPFWNRVDALGPEAFYDYHHLMPDSRRRFTAELAQWLTHTSSGDPER